MTMTYLLGKLNLRAFRYCVLVTFLICSALNASIAAWNLGLVRDLGLHMPSVLNIDSYIIFLGAFGLAILFTIGAVELACITWFIGTVWFECVWVSLSGLMYLAAAIALSVITSQDNCINFDQIPECVSIQVLLAFTWLCAMTLVVYFSTFMFAVVINQKKDATIWYSMMHQFPWAGTCAILASAPPTPTTLSHFQQNTVPTIHAPKPKHARPNAGTTRPPIFSWRSGLSHEYQIEHYRPPTNTQRSSSRSRGSKPGQSGSADLPSAAAPPVISAPALPPIDSETSNKFASSLYPMYMQQTNYNFNPGPSHPEPALTHASLGAAAHVARAPVHTALPPSPPPLGNWPRLDVMSRPVDKGKRKAPPLIIPRGDFSGNSVPSNPRTGSTTTAREREREMHISNAPSSFAPMRPVGPRRRSGSSDLSNKLSPLDLTKIEIEYA